jgi:hypothetical protein
MVNLSVPGWETNRKKFMERTLHGLTDGHCEYQSPAREDGMENMVSQLVNVSFARNGRWKGNEDGMKKNLKGLTAGQCEFCPQGNGKQNRKWNT